MSASTVDPALAELDPAGYVEAVAALAINDEDPRWREQAALWRWHVAVWHWLGRNHHDAVVAAARAYADGGHAVLTTGQAVS